MPDMKLAYIVSNVGNGNKYLSDSMEFVPLLLSQQSIETNRDGNSTCNDATMPTEIFVVGLGSYSRRPVLFVRTKTDVLIYRVSESMKFLAPTFLFIMSYVFVTGFPLLSWSFKNSIPQIDSQYNAAIS